MTRKNNKKTSHIFESILFAFLCCVIALRLSFMENPDVVSFNLPGVFYDNFVSVVISSLLIIAAVVWLAGKLAEGMRLGALEYGILIFIVAAVLSTIVASNRRVAIINSITILSAMLTGAVLSNLLTTLSRKKILLFVLIGMAVANVYQCTEQYFSSNRLMIEEYKAEPTVQLQKLGIEPGSFEQMLYEHRLYSKDVRGFFTTGNSVSSLLVLAIFCVFAVFDLRANFTLKRLWVPTLLLAVLFAGLVMAHSKGAAMSLVVGGLLLLLSVNFGRFFRQHRGLIIIVAVILIILCTAFIIGYGITHGTLPGGNSMLVRWQYWSATAKIIAGHLITGIGGGNFASYYTQYKIPDALETVRDPHCFILSILSQYGIVGLAGFCLAIFWPIITYRMQEKPPVSPAENNLAAFAKSCGILIVLVLLFARPIVIRAQIGGSIDVILYILTIMYAAPAFFLATTLWLCTRTEEQTKTGQVFYAALFAGLAAVMMHNLIDFALFEPGIMTAFWAAFALVYSDYRANISDDRSIPSKTKKIIFACAAIITAAVIIWFCIIPGAKTAFKSERARMLSAQGESEKATALLAQAIADDTINPVPAALCGKMLLYEFESYPGNSPDILLAAEKPLLTAIQRDKADYKNYENLAEVYETLAQITPDRRRGWFEKAFVTLQQAIKLYPSSSDLHIELAKAAEEIGETDVAVEHYKKAVEIEDAYTKQFKIMYPGKEVFSRMGKIKYNEAKEKIENLRK